MTCVLHLLQLFQILDMNEQLLSFLRLRGLEETANKKMIEDKVICPTEFVVKLTCCTTSAQNCL